MTISAELQRIYASAPVGAEFIMWETISVSHSAFTEGTYHFVRNRTTPMDKNFETVLVTFQPLFFDFKLPTRNSNGAVNMEISIANIDRSFMEQIELAIAAPKEPIIVKFSVYTDTSDDPQLDPALELTLSNIAANATTITGTASRADVLNRPFPRQIFRPSGDNSFPGLDR